MRIIITGATGFIGTHLTKRLTDSGHKVIALSRNPKNAQRILGNEISCLQWAGKDTTPWLDQLNGDYGIINLAGENIAAGRWSADRKQKILRSRVDAGEIIVNAVRQAAKKPEFVMQASAIGIYGSSRELIFDEETLPGKGFLADVCKRWEESSKEIENMRIRRIIIRTGVVLGQNGGIMKKMSLPFKLFIGGPPGDGKQGFSWIHMDDEVRAIQFLLESKHQKGIFNLTAPNPVFMTDFTKIYGKALNRPSWLPVPSFVLKTLFGEMAEEVILSGQKVMPKALLKAGFTFNFPDLKNAVNDLTGLNT
ncbi:MAG: TIGR01777 family oxidoreductase [Calditrichaceae bacterium]